MFRGRSFLQSPFGPVHEKKKDRSMMTSLCLFCPSCGVKKANILTTSKYKIWP